MKLTMYSGCTRGDAIDVDDKNLLDLTESKQREVAIEVFTKLLNDNGAGYMLKELINSHYTDSIDMGNCDQCGDWTCDYILEV